MPVGISNEVGDDAEMERHKLLAGVVARRWIARTYVLGRCHLVRRPVRVLAIIVICSHGVAVFLLSLHSSGVQCLTCAALV